VNPTPSTTPTALITPTPDFGIGALQSKTVIFGIVGILLITAMVLFLLFRKKR
jgi:LPXTG-motif cell wall-anchored protein